MYNPFSIFNRLEIRKGYTIRRYMHLFNGCLAITFEQVSVRIFIFHFLWDDFIFPVVPLLILLPFVNLMFVRLYQ